VSNGNREPVYGRYGVGQPFGIPLYGIAGAAAYGIWDPAAARPEARATGGPCSTGCAAPEPPFFEVVSIVTPPIVEMPAGPIDGKNRCFLLSQVPNVAWLLVKHNIRFLDYDPIPADGEYRVNDRCLYIARPPRPGDTVLAKYYPQGVPVALGTPPAWPQLPIGWRGWPPQEGARWVLGRGAP